MNKTVLITGASSGIGEGCARKFASQGARLILNSRSADKLEAIAEELKENYNTECLVLPFDVCDRKAAAETLSSLPDEWQSIDILINNAGLAIGVDKEHEGNIEEWEIMIDTNIKALLSMTRLVVPGMVERGCGHIINIGSIAGDAGCLRIVLLNKDRCKNCGDVDCNICNQKAKEEFRTQLLNHYIV